MNLGHDAKSEKWKFHEAEEKTAVRQITTLSRQNRMKNAVRRFRIDLKTERRRRPLKTEFESGIQIHERRDIEQLLFFSVNFVSPTWRGGNKIRFPLSERVRHFHDSKEKLIILAVPEVKRGRIVRVSQRADVGDALNAGNGSLKALPDGETDDRPLQFLRRATGSAEKGILGDKSKGFQTTGSK